MTLGYHFLIALINYSSIVYEHGISTNCSLYKGATPSVYSYSSPLQDASTNITTTTQAKGL